MESVNYYVLNYETGVNSTYNFELPVQKNAYLQNCVLGKHLLVHNTSTLNYN